MYEMYLEKHDPINYLLRKHGEVDIHKLKSDAKYKFYFELLY